MVQCMPFPSSDTETRSQNTRIIMYYHLRQHLTSHNILQSSPSAHLFLKLARGVLLGVFLFAQYVETHLFSSCKGLSRDEKSNLPMMQICVQRCCDFQNRSSLLSLHACKELTSHISLQPLLDCRCREATGCQCVAKL